MNSDLIFHLYYHEHLSLSLFFSDAVVERIRQDCVAALPTRRDASQLQRRPVVDAVRPPPVLRRRRYARPLPPTALKLPTPLTEKV